MALAERDWDCLSLVGSKPPGSLRYTPTAGRHERPMGGSGAGRRQHGSKRPVTTDVRTGGSLRQSSDDSKLLASAVIGRQAWKLSTPQPRCGAHIGQEGGHHLGASKAGAALHEMKYWPPNDTKYVEEYPEKHAERAKAMRSYYTRDAEFELSTLDIQGDPVDDKGKFHEEKRYPEHAVPLEKQQHTGKHTFSHQKNFGYRDTGLGGLKTSYQHGAPQEVTEKVWNDYISGKEPITRHNAEAGLVASAPTNIFHVDHEADGAAQDVLKSTAEVLYREPKIGMASELAHESRTIKARWNVKNGPDTFLVHRHYGAKGGPHEQHIPGVEYPGKWGAQVDDGYKFKKRSGPRKYFQNAGDRMGGGVPEVMNHDHDTKPHAIPSRSKSTYSRQVDNNGMQPGVEFPSGKLITSSSWTEGRATNMDLYKKNEADSLVWLGDVPVGTKVSRCPPNGISQGEVDLTHEYISKDRADRPRSGYRPQHAKKNLSAPPVPVDRRWTRRTSQMHAHRAIRVPFALHEEGGGNGQPSAAEKDTAGPANQAAPGVTARVLFSRLVNANPAYETTTGKHFSDHTLEDFTKDFGAALTRNTKAISKRDFEMSLQAPKPFHPEQNCNM